MARVLAYTSPARGHLYPLVPILDELARRGHEIAIRTLASQVPLMQAQGFAAAPIASTIEAWSTTITRRARRRAASGAGWPSSPHERSTRFPTFAPLAEITRPIVLVSTSSEFQDDGRLVTTALEALADEDVDVVATLPAAELPGTRVPPNARVEWFLPHAPILARAACAVTHGGAGVTQKALAAGVPVCVVPFGRDQLEVARRVEVADAGTRLPARRLNPDRLRAKVREAMGKRAGASRVAAGFAATGGATTAADAVDELLHTPSASLGPHRPRATTELAS